MSRKKNNRNLEIINSFHRDISGESLVCIYPSKTLTEGGIYKVRGTFNYLNTYGVGKKKYQQFDTFVTLKNDFGYTIKVNL